MLCDQLKYIRQANGMTQQQLSDALGINRSTYAPYETGRNRPDIDVLAHIAEVCGVTVDYIIHLNLETDDK